MARIPSWLKNKKAARAKRAQLGQTDTGPIPNFMRRRKAALLTSVGAGLGDTYDFLNQKSEAIKFTGIGGTPTPTPPTPTPTPPTPTPTPPQTTVTVFGDSIANDVSASPSSQSWSNRLAAFFGLTRKNLSISGSVMQNAALANNQPMASNGRDRALAAITGANKSDQLWIALGYNDGRYTGAPDSMNAASYGNDLSEVIQLARMNGYAANDIIVFAPYYVTDDGMALQVTPGFSGQTRPVFEQYVAAAAAAAAAYGVRYFDTYAAGNNATWINDVNNNDDVHPTNVGMGVVFEAASTGIVTPNTRAFPVSVGGVVSGDGITVTCSNVVGAASYEYALVLNGVDILTNTTGNFVGLADGTYRAKARAVFGDGKGRWAFASEDVVVNANPNVFVFDTFVDVPALAGQRLSTHKANKGGAWIAQPGIANNSPPGIDTEGYVYNVTANCIWLNNQAPPSANYTVEGYIKKRSVIATQTAGIGARFQTATQSGYFARYNESTGAINLFRNSTPLGTSPVVTLNVGDNKRLTLSVNGTGASVNLVVTFDGVEIINWNDTDSARIVDAGFPAIRSTIAATPTTGLGVGRFKVTNLG